MSATGISIEFSGRLFGDGDPLEGAAHRAVNELVDTGAAIARRDVRSAAGSRRFYRRVRAYRGRNGIEGFVDAPGTGFMPRWLNSGERSGWRGNFRGYGFFDRTADDLRRRMPRIVGLHVAAAVAWLNGWGR